MWLEQELNRVVELGARVTFRELELESSARAMWLQERVQALEWELSGAMHAVEHARGRTRRRRRRIGLRSAHALRRRD